MARMRLAAAILAVALVDAVLAGPGGAIARGGEYAVVDRVMDGDSLKVRQHNRSFQVRLWGIDSPEHGQRYGDQAKSRCRRLVEGRQVVLGRKYIDRYDRVVALVWVDGVLLNEELVRQGTAWVHDRYCDEGVCAGWHDLEGEARRGRIGLWRDAAPVAPWIWKGRQRSRRSWAD